MGSLVRRPDPDRRARRHQRAEWQGRRPSGPARAPGPAPRPRSAAGVSGPAGSRGATVSALQPSPTWQPPARTSRPSWPVPAALVALSAIPVAAGTLRLVQLAGRPPVMPVDGRFAGFPLALIFHILGAATYAVVGAFQFVPRLRRGSWHRRAGRVLAVAGLLVAGSALWMTVSYSPKPGTGDLLFLLRL